jgi:hypothetical protein
LYVVSSTGYYYSLSWTGSIYPSWGYYTEAGGGGTLFNESQYVPVAKTALLINGALVAYESADSYGNAIADSSITGHLSSIDTQNVLSSSAQTFPSYVKAYRLVPITRATAGIPETISLPITVKYE